MPLEAMGCGVLPVCAYNTGMTDYLDHLPALRIPCPQQVPSPSYSAIWQEELLQWQPDFDALVEHIRWCYNHRDDVALRGAVCAEAAPAMTRTIAVVARKRMRFTGVPSMSLQKPIA
jgi:hypothetical protein